MDRSTTLAGRLVDRYAEENKDKKVFMSVSKALEQDVDKALLVIVDAHSPEILDSKEFYEMFNGSVSIIDHHRKSVNYIEENLLSFHESSASSACEMVTDVIQCINEQCINTLEAEALLAGITLDTKNFTVGTGVGTFGTAAFLRSKGAENPLRLRKIFAGSMDTYKGKLQFVMAAEMVKNCAVSVAEVDCESTRIAASQAADELLTIQDIDASFVIFSSDSTVIVSARSYGKINDSA